MPRVFVPMQPARFDHATKLWIPIANLKPAEAYGDLVILFPQTASRAPTGQLLDQLREKMHDFTRDDYVCAVGDPAIIAAASCVAARMCGGTLRLLRWDRQSHAYDLVEMNP